MHTGVIRDSTCTFMSTWQAYKCFGMNYRMLVIESLDSDTETRRLSPVAVLGDGYVDLLNGKYMSARDVTKYKCIIMNRSCVVNKYTYTYMNRRCTISFLFVFF